MSVPNLRSPYDEVNGLPYFGRMLDKIRLQAAGTLPEDYRPNLGTGFDGRCCSFLEIDYAALVEQVTAGADDGAALAWAHAQGRQPTDEQVEIWKEFMRKRGWKDEGTPQLLKRKTQSAFVDREDIQTFFDFIEADEGRSPRMV